MDFDLTEEQRLLQESLARLLGDRDPWAELMPQPQRLPDDLVAEGRTITVARVQAMHEGKRRARARRNRPTAAASAPSPATTAGRCVERASWGLCA